jgi:L-2,4-diaminobutyric acid acetyltransferase
MLGRKIHRLETTHFYSPTEQDGAAVWRLIRDCGGLDLNSSYAYLLLCDRFRETCTVARSSSLADEELAGAALGFRVPRQPDTLFVWQVAVRPEARGAGLGVALLDVLGAAQACHGVRFIEAHVAPQNRASEALFRKFARLRQAPLMFQAGFAADDFPDRHAAERLVRIGPMGHGAPSGHAERK